MVKKMPPRRRRLSCEQFEQRAMMASLTITKQGWSPPQQMLAGGTSEPALTLLLEATGGAVKIRGLDFQVPGKPTSLWRLPIKREGVVLPLTYAVATPSQPADAIALRASITGDNLLVQPGTSVRIHVFAQLRSDQTGASLWDTIQVGLMNAQAVDVANNSIPLNDGDGSDEGEIFIGTTNPGIANKALWSSKSQAVYAKAASITDVNADPDGSTITTGIGPLADIQIVAMQNVNSRDSTNSIVPSQTFLTVESHNVAFDRMGFTLFVQTDLSKKVVGVPYDMLGNVITTPTVSGNFLVRFTFINKVINASVLSGGTKTFTFERNITNPRIDPTIDSTYQGSLRSFNKAGTFGPLGSHVQWIDMDSGKSKYLTWFESTTTVVRSTSYSLPAAAIMASESIQKKRDENTDAALLAVLRETNRNNIFTASA